MQNLPITASITPASGATQAAPADSNTAQPTEPFSNVLARQRVTADAPDANARNSKQAAASPSDDTSASSGDAQSATAQASTPVDVGLFPNGLIPSAVLPGEVAQAQPASADTDRKASSPQAQIADAATALPGGIPAALLPAPATAGSAPNEKERPRESSPDAASALPGSILPTLAAQTPAPQEKSASVRAQPLAAATGTARETNTTSIPGAAVRSGQATHTLDALSQARAQGDASFATENTHAPQASAFSAALETMGKEGAKAMQSGSGALEPSAQALQPDAASGVAALMQGATAPVAASANATAQAVVNTPVTNDNWGDEFSQKVTWMATQNTQNAELHLNPPQLGPLDVVLSVSGDQATALFTSPHAAVRDAVEQALPKLREMLADNGIMLGNATVSDQSAKDQQAWLGGQQQNGRGSFSGAADGGAVGRIASGSAASPVRRHHGMVDTFA